MAVIFRYGVQVLELHCSPLERRVGKFKAGIETSNHYRVTTSILSAVAWIFNFLAIVISRCDKAKIEKYRICYLNDCKLRSALGVGNWDEIPLERSLDAKAFRVYRTTYNIINSKGEEKDVLAIAFQIRIIDDPHSEDVQDKVIKTGLLILYNGANYRGSLPETEVRDETSLWSYELCLPNHYITDRRIDENHVKHMLQKFDKKHKPAEEERKPLLLSTIGSCTAKITDRAIAWFAALKRGELVLADEQNGSEASFQLVRPIL